MPRSLADARKKVVILPTKPADPEAPTIAELEAGLDASCRIVASTYTVGPSASETVDEKALCEEGNVQALSTSNYSAEFDIFRYFDETTGLPEEGTAGSDENIGDQLYQMLKAKGTIVWLYERETGLKALEPFVAGEPVEGYELLVDNPQKPQDQGGFIKRHIVGLPQKAWLDAEVAGTTP
ncbi:hypothetical protein [Brevibacterium aurantiacum]|uniref:Uncharacterized protein n=1 Tax=Brevibacterium aurantiacum TaxID=273384 RepID=A0A556C5H2_BREAU|nr:hypothetical protein [Brevibacterium aurantiacum]TSI12630.1 hypothetical protein FO013_19335 [Brevibacterium aurantiacum]